MYPSAETRPGPSRFANVVKVFKLILLIFLSKYHHECLKDSDYTFDLLQRRQLIKCFMTEVSII